MCQNLNNRIHNIQIKNEVISGGRSKSRNCNNGNSNNIGREQFGQQINILVDTAIIY
jgi:hypothetical protein